MTLPEQPELKFTLTYNEALITEYGQACYQAGRDGMKAECVKAVHNCLNDCVFTADMAGHAGRHLQLAENAIKELK